MAKKKMYVTPECVAYKLEPGMLCESNLRYSKDNVTDNIDIGFSKGFSGGVEDDAPLDLWAEEEK